MISKYHLLMTLLINFIFYYIFAITGTLMNKKIEKYNYLYSPLIKLHISSLVAEIKC